MFYHKLDKIARILIYSTALLPLLISPYLFFPDKFAKGIVFRVIVEALIIIAIYLWMKKKLVWPGLSPIGKTLLIFWLVSLMATFFAQNKFLAFWGEGSRGGGFFNFTHFVIYFFLLIALLNKREYWLKLLDLAYAAAAVSGIIALIQYFNPSFLAFPFAYINPSSPGATMGNPNFFSAFLLFFFFWGLIRLTEFRKNKLYSGLLLASLALITIAIILTRTRGVYLGLLFGVFLYLLFFPYKKPVIRIAIGSVFIILILLSFMGLKSLEGKYVANPILARFTSLNYNNASIQTRLEGWSLLLEASKEKPLFGFGPENLEFAFNKYYRASFATHGEAETYWDRAHNFAVETIVNTGYIGFIALIFLWFTIFKELQKVRIQDEQNRFYAHGLQVIFASYILQNLTNFDTFVSFLPLFLFLGFTHHLSSSQNKLTNNQNNKPETDHPVARLVITLLIIAYIWALWSLHLKPLTINAQSLRLLNSSDVQKSVPEFEKLLKQHTYLDFDNRSKYIIYIQPLLGRDNVDQNSKRVLIKRTIVLLEENIKNNPLSVKSKLDLAAQYARAAMVEQDPKQKEQYNIEAVKQFRELKDLSPRRQRILIEEAKFLLIKKDIAKAIENLRTSLLLNPDVTESHWWLGIGYLLEGKKDRGEFWLKKAMEMNFSVGNEYVKFLENIYKEKYSEQDLEKLFEKLKTEF